MRDSIGYWRLNARLHAGLHPSNNSLHGLHRVNNPEWGLRHLFSCLLLLFQRAKPTLLSHPFHGCPQFGRLSGHFAFLRMVCSPALRIEAIPDIVRRVLFGKVLKVVRPFTHASLLTSLVARLFSARRPVTQDPKVITLGLLFSTLDQCFRISRVAD